LRPFVRHLTAGAVRGCCSLIPALVLLTGCQSWHTLHGFTDAQIAALERVGFTRTADRGAMEFDATDRLLFASGESRLGPEATRALEHIGYVLIAMHVEHIFIDGYTDAEGGVTYNLDLSMRRAKTVAGVLVDIGIAAKDIQVHGYGKTSPVADNGSRVGRMQNRRVAVVVSSE